MRLLPHAMGLLVFVTATACPRTTDPMPTPRLPLPGAEETPPVAPITEEGVRSLLEEFMEARIEGDEESARFWLGPEAYSQYADAEGGLVLIDDFVEWGVVTMEAADPSSFEVLVRIEAGDGSSIEEFLFVGIGLDHTGAERELIVRGAQRRA